MGVPLKVADLHSVDIGIEQLLLPTITKDQGWSVLVAHFLGVDHCGHTYGPDHPAMAAKLLQINGAIENVTKAVDNDTLLVVLGDHGMTTSGDHGGDSDDETNSALFMYANRPFVADPSTDRDTNMVQTLLQIDLAPTLALMLGIPVPFGSLGTASCRLLAAADNVNLNTRLARLNAAQVWLLTGTPVLSPQFPPRTDTDRLRRSARGIPAN